MEKKKNKKYRKRVNDVRGTPYIRRCIMYIYINTKNKYLLYRPIIGKSETARLISFECKKHIIIYYERASLMTYLRSNPNFFFVTGGPKEQKKVQT